MVSNLQYRGLPDLGDWQAGLPLFLLKKVSIFTATEIKKCNVIWKGAFLDTLSTVLLFQENSSTETENGKKLLRSWLNKSMKVQMTDARTLIGEC